MSFGKSSGSTSASQQGSGFQQSVPVNLQNPAYVGLAPGVAAGLAALYQGGPNGYAIPGSSASAGSNPQAAYVQPMGYNPGAGQGGQGGSFAGTPFAGGTFDQGQAGGQAGQPANPATYQATPGAYQPPGSGGGFFSPFQVNGQSSASATNPLVAQLTPDQLASLGYISQAGNPGNMGGVSPNQAGAALSGFTNPNYAQPLTNNIPGVGAAFSRFLDPNFAANLASSPQTQAAISSATNPIMQAFRTQTVPSLTSAATQAGQRTNGPGQAGSSAFDQAFATAQGNELSAIGQTAGNIANQAYQTGLNIQANAPSQATNAAGALEQQMVTGQQAPVQLSSAELGNMINSLQAEVLPQLTQQYGINAGLQLFNTQIQTILQALGLGGQVSQPQIAYNQAGSSQQSGQSSGHQSGFNFGIGSVAGSLFGGGA